MPSIMEEFAETKNFTQWDQGDNYEEKFHKAYGTADAAERTAMYRELALYKAENAPGIPMPSPYIINAYWPWVKNYYGEINCAMTNYTPVVSRIWIDQNLKKELGF